MAGNSRRNKSILNMFTLSTISQIGARLSLAKVHVKRLEQAFRNRNEVRHFLYIVDPTNQKILDYVYDVAQRNRAFQVLTRNDNTFTDFARLKKRAPFGGDKNYDFVIYNHVETTHFLTLHDDSILSTDIDLFADLKSISRNCDFFGYNDTRKEISGYDKIFLDKVPLSDIRIGTWFFFGNTKVYRHGKYGIGMYRNFLWPFYKLYFRTFRLTAKSPKIWLNGGFDFNIRARLNNERIRCEKVDFKYATHFTKFTGFFTARGMLGFSDTEQEILVWSDHYKRSDQIEKDLIKKYFSSIQSFLYENDVDDAFVTQFLDSLED